MKKINTYHLGLHCAFMLFLSISCLPNAANASSSRPTCSLSVVIEGIQSDIHGSSPVLVRAGMPMSIMWESNRATKGIDQSGHVVTLDGIATVTPARNTAYKYTFSRGSARVTCRVSVAVVTGYVTPQSKGDVSSRPTLAGKAKGISSVVVSLTPAGTTTALYTSGSLRVRSGKWSVRPSVPLPDGLYQVVVSSSNGRNRVVIATSTLQIGTVPVVTAAAPIVVVVPVPLLIGGVAHPGTSVAVAYLQVINISTATATLSGLTLLQNGTAPVSAVVGLTAVTDNGVARGTVGNMLTGTPFVGSSVFVPLVVTLAPREMRLVTIKAVMSPLAAAYHGTTLTLWVSEVSGNLRPHATFPLFGTVWTIGN